MKRILIVFGLVSASLLLNIISPNLTAVYAQELKWIYEDVGYDKTVTIRVTESSGDSYLDDYKLDVAGSRYLLPATANVSYEYQIPKTVHDVGFEIVEAPEWLSVSSGGNLTGTPDDADVGNDIKVIVLVANPYDSIRQKNYVIKVRSSGDIDDTYLPHAIGNEHYAYQLPENNPADTYEIIEGPPWLKIDSASGKLSGLPFVEKQFGSLPVVSEDGTVFIVSDYFTDDILYAIAPDGTELWQHEFDRNIYPPAIGQDGTLYLGSSSDIFYAFDPDNVV
ncbi:PQQ-binding-like beta-propeller repeat protein, partial [Candidatus Latescibacterota bacterium]